MRAGGVRDHDVRAAPGGVPHGLELRVHAALREGALLAALHELERVAHLADRGDAPPVRVEEAVHRREEDERVGVDELHDEGGEPVVVAEGEALELVVRHDVVLVDDGHDACAHEVVERAAEVRNAAAVGEVGMREEDLPDLDAARGEEPLVLGDEARLADGRAHLDVRDLGGAGLEPERLDAGGDRARAHEQHLRPRLAQFADAVDDAPQRRVVGVARLLRDRVRADLHDDAPRVPQDGALPQQVVQFFHRRTV